MLLWPFLIGYYYEEFLTLQQAVDVSIIQEVNQSFDSNSFQLRLKQYPYPPYNYDRFVEALDGLLPGLIGVAFIPIAYKIFTDSLLETEKKLKVIFAINFYISCHLSL